LSFLNFEVRLIGNMFMRQQQQLHRIPQFLGFSRVQKTKNRSGQRSIAHEVDAGCHRELPRRLALSFSRHIHGKFVRRLTNNTGGSFSFVSRVRDTYTHGVVLRHLRHCMPRCNEWVAYHLQTSYLRLGISGQREPRAAAKPESSSAEASLLDLAWYAVKARSGR